MKRSLLKCSGWISLLLFMVHSMCNAQDKLTCKALVQFHGEEVSGRMIFKQLSKDTIRFVFFNELGMSFVEGSVSLDSRRSAIRIRTEYSYMVPFLSYKPFSKNFERGLREFLSVNTREITLPFSGPPSKEEMKIYRHGNKFIFKIQPVNN